MKPPNRLLLDGIGSSLDACCCLEYGYLAGLSCLAAFLQEKLAQLRLLPSLPLHWSDCCLWLSHWITPQVGQVLVRDSGTLCVAGQQHQCTLCDSDLLSFTLVTHKAPGSGSQQLPPLSLTSGTLCVAGQQHQCTLCDSDLLSFTLVTHKAPGLGSQQLPPLSRTWPLVHCWVGQLAHRWVGLQPGLQTAFH